MSVYPRKSSTKSLLWLWLIPALLLTTFLAARQLDKTGLWHDEVWSYYVAGGDHYGPLSLADVWQRVSENDPTQGMGYPLALSQWGAVAGWSPFATRAFSLLTGILSIAMVYRLGSDVISRRVGLYAALTLSVSAFYIYYLHEVRAYSEVILFGALLLWSYWRIMTRPNAGWMVSVCFVLGGAGLLYTNYYTVILLLALALYHLFIAAKTRRWLHPVLLAAIVGIIFIPALHAFVRGYGRYTTWSVIFNVALSPAELIAFIANFASNGQILLLVILIVIILLVASRRISETGDIYGTRYMLFLAFMVASTGVIMNAILLVIDNTRVRYLLTLWIPMSIGLGIALDALSRRAQIGKWLAAGILALWLAGGVVANFEPEYLHDITGGTRIRWQTMTDILHRDGLTEDAFAFYSGDYDWDAWFTFDYATKTLPFPSLVAFTLLDEQNEAWANESLHNAQRIWYGENPMRSTDSDVYRAIQAVLADGLTLCEGNIVNQPDMRLSLYVRSDAFCPDTAPVMNFADKIALAVDTQQTDKSLKLNIGVTMTDVPPDTYSLAVHVLDAGGNLAAQSDSGIPDGRFVIMQPEIALDGVPAGTYTVHIIVYNWQTGERLTGTNLSTQASGDSVPLADITIQ